MLNVFQPETFVEADPLPSADLGGHRDTRAICGS